MPPPKAKVGLAPGDTIMFSISDPWLVLGTVKETTDEYIQFWPVTYVESVKRCFTRAAQSKAEITAGHDFPSPLTVRRDRIHFWFAASPSVCQGIEALGALEGAR